MTVKLTDAAQRKIDTAKTEFLKVRERGSRSESMDAYDALVAVAQKAYGPKVSKTGTPERDAFNALLKDVDRGIFKIIDAKLGAGRTKSDSLRKIRDRSPNEAEVPSGRER